MIKVLIIIYASGCVFFGFFLMKKYDKFLSKINEVNGLLYYCRFENDTSKR